MCYKIIKLVYTVFIINQTYKSKPYVFILYLFSLGDYLLAAFLFLLK